MYRVWNTAYTSTHWGRVTHICVSNLTIIGSDNGLLPGPCQAIIWINAGILLTGPLGTNFSEILIECLTFLFKKIQCVVCEMAAILSRPQCVNSSGPAGWCRSNFKCVILRLVLHIDIISISWEMIMWVPQNPLMISQHWFRYHCNMVSLGHNELALSMWATEYSIWIRSISCLLMP